MPSVAEPSVRRRVLALAALAAAVTSGAVVAQPMDLRTPVESPLWWTVSDDVTPAELRDAFRDVEFQRELYRKASSRGEAPPITEEKLSLLVWYGNGSLYPELIPLYMAFSALATNMAHGTADPFWSDTTIRQGLIAAGMGEQDADRVLAAIPPMLAMQERLVQDIAPDSMAFLALLDEVYQLTGQQLSKFAQNDPASVVEIARITREPPSRVRELRRTYLRSPIVEAVLPTLAGLRQELTQASWRAFRGYLRTKVVPQMSGVDFAAAPSDIHFIFRERPLRERER